MRYVAVLLLTLFLAGCIESGPKYDYAQTPAFHVETLKGLVEIGGNRVYLVANYWSRSRVSYLVIGPLADRLASFSGMVVTVEGRVRRKGFSGYVYVERILQVRKPFR